MEKGIRKTSPPGSTSLTSCVCDASKGFLADYATCLCGPGKVWAPREPSTLSACAPAPADTYQPRLDELAGIACPEGARSPPGSKTLTDCRCTDTETIWLDDNRFTCKCPRAFFMRGGACVRCSTCDLFAHWRKNCTGTSPGTCVKCGGCADGKRRVECNWVYEGRCQDETLLALEPLCPTKVTVKTATVVEEVYVMQDLGGFGFEDVFGVAPELAPFACGKVCDGTTTFDGTQCGGPFACGVRSCVQRMRADISVVGARADAMACPVVLSAADSAEDSAWKTAETCRSCDTCGDAGTRPGATLARNWGAGCARECSRLRCSGVQIWDWTAKACVDCDELRDQRLCAGPSRDMMHGGAISGHQPLLYMEGCSAVGRLDAVTYGECRRCQDFAACDSEPTLFPESCRSTAGGLQPRCGVCARAGRSDVDVVRGAYQPQPGGPAAPLYCQITPCKPVDGAPRTGARQTAVCMERCAALACPQHQVLVPCRLPHQTRCDDVGPAGAAVAPVFAGAHPSALAGPEVNLLSEPPGGDASAFASFENTLVTLGVASEEYQCVWNAAQITDSRAFPGGISRYLFPPASAYADGARGSKACRRWELDLEAGELPTLPLQNTVSGASTRRVLVDTEAHVLSYRYDGAFTGVDDGAAEAWKRVGPVRAAALLEDSPTRLEGTGDLYLMLTLRRQTARVVVDVPADRPWPGSLLFTCAVLDMTPQGGELRFSAFRQHGEGAAVQLRPQAAEPPEALDSSVLALFHVHFTPGATAAWGAWSSRLASACTQADSAAVFLQLEGACRVLAHTKAVPMRITLRARDSCDAACVSALPLALFFSERAFESARVAGASAYASEVAVGTPSTDLLAQSQRRALRRLQNFTAARHFEMQGAVFERALPWASAAVPQQAHAVDAYSRCAVLLSSEASVLCAGAEGTETLWARNSTGERALGVGFAEQGGTPLVLALLDLQRSFARSGSLYVLGRPPVEVLEALTAGRWLSFAVLACNVTALEVDEGGRMLVRHYELADAPLRLRPRYPSAQWAVFPNATFAFASGSTSTEHPWLRFSRVVTAPGSLHAVVATVRERVEAADSTALELLACAVPRESGAAPYGCARAALGAGDAPPGLISIALLDAELWLVSVLGQAFEFEARGELRAVPRSALAHRSFVQAGAARQVQAQLSGAHGRALPHHGVVYYTMDVRSLSNGGLVAFLPGFSRVDASTLSAQIELSRQEALQKPEASFAGYAMLVAYTGTQSVSTLEQLDQLSMLTLAFREAQRGQTPRSMQVTTLRNSYRLGEQPLSEYQLSDAVGTWLLQDEKQTLLELGMPELVGGPRDCYGLLDEAVLAAADQLSPRSSVALVLAAAELAPPRSWALLVRLGAAPANHAGVRGLALAMCTPDIVDVLASVDASAAARAVVSYNAELAAWSLYWSAEGVLQHGELFQSTPNAKVCVVLAPGSAIVKAHSHSGGVDLHWLAAALQAAPAEPALPDVLPPRWQRERFVVPASAPARLELRFERTAVQRLAARDPSVGVDDLQLLPLLSEPTALEHGGLEARVRVPARDALARAGLAHLVRAHADGLAWLHVAVALQTGSPARGGCRYTAQLWREDPAGARHPLPLGCALAAAAAHARGTWAQGTLQLPLDDGDFLLRLEPFDAAPACRAREDDLLLAFLAASAALYECPAGSFLAGGAAPRAGACVPCRGDPERLAETLAPSLAEEAALCGPGRRLRGCPALLRRNDSARCEPCGAAEGAAEVAANRAVYADVLRADAEPCRWTCRDGYYDVGAGALRRCARCGEPERCAAGHFWSNCSVAFNSQCRACPALPPSADGERREHYVDAAGEPQPFDVEVLPAAHNDSALAALLLRAEGTHRCRSRCAPGAFRRAAACERCRSPALALEQLLQGAPSLAGFFAVAPCSAGADTAAAPCPPRPGTQAVAHDPAATGDCPRRCLPGWGALAEDFPFLRRCAPCPNATLVAAQAGALRTFDALEEGVAEEAFAFAPDACDFECKPPYLRLSARLAAANASALPPGLPPLDPARTCVRCAEDACAVGAFPTGPLCQCAPCAMHELRD